MRREVLLFSISLFVISIFSNCASKNVNNVEKVKVPNEFLVKYRQIVSDFNKNHKLNTKIDKKFKEGMLNEDKFDDTASSLYSYFKSFDMTEDCMLNAVKSGLNQIYDCHSKLLKQMIKIYPNILKEHYGLYYNAGNFWNKEKKECKDVVLEKCSIIYNEKEHVLDKNGKMNIIEK